MISRKSRDKKKTEREIRATELQSFFELFGEDPLTDELFLKLNSSDKPDEHEIFLFPGREGCGCIFSHLAKYLDVPAVGVQYNNKVPEKNLSIEQMTNDIYPHFLERHKNRKDFFIVAYSFGALVALELIKKLEAEGFVGKLIIIDSSPKFLDIFITERIVGTNDDEIETSWLVHVSLLFAPRLSPELPAMVKNCKSWDEKVDVFLEHVPTDMCGLTRENMRTLFNVMHLRTKAGTVCCKSHFSGIDTSILLIKATYKTLTQSLCEDYELSNITSGRVDVCDIKASHVTILLSQEVAKVINSEWDLLYAELF